MADFNLDYTITPEVDFTKIKSQLSQLKTLIETLSKEKLIDDKETIDNLKKIEKEFKDLDKVVDDTVKSTKDIDNEIKNTTKSANGLKDAFVGAFAGFTAANAVAAGLDLIKQGFTQAITSALAFERGLAEVSAITGVTGDGLNAMGESARELAKTFGTDVLDQLETFKGILSKLGPAIGNNPEALESMADSINILAKASGLTATESMEALTTVLLQFGIDLTNPKVAAEAMASAMNVMAAAAQYGAAEVPQIKEALEQCGVAAKGANISIEETNTAIQILAKGGKVGSEAGIALRNVMLKLQDATGPAAEALKKMGLTSEELGKTLTTEGLGAAILKLKNGLEGLATDQERNVALMKIFGLENQSAAGILVNFSGEMEDFTKNITGTNAAIEQSNIILNTNSEKWERIKSNVSDFLVSIGQGFIDTFVDIASVIDDVTSKLDFMSVIMGNGKNETEKTTTKLTEQEQEYLALKIAIADNNEIKRDAIIEEKRLRGEIIGTNEKIREQNELLRKDVKKAAMEFGGAYEFMSYHISKLKDATEGTLIKEEQAIAAKLKSGQLTEKGAIALFKEVDARKQLLEQLKKGIKTGNDDNDNNNNAIKITETLTQKLERLKNAYLESDNEQDKIGLLTEIRNTQKAIDDFNAKKQALEITLKYGTNAEITDITQKITPEIIEPDMDKLKGKGKIEKLIVPIEIAPVISEDSENFSNLLDSLKDVDWNYAFSGMNEAMLQATEDTANTLVVFGAGLSEMLGNISDMLYDSMNEMAQSWAKGGEDSASFAEMATVAAATVGAQFAQMAIDGKANLGDYALVLLDMVDMAVNAMIAQIIAYSLGSAESVATWGTLGLTKSAILVGLLKVGVMAAKAAITAGADQGVVGIDYSYNTAPTARDTIPTLLRLGETVVTPEGTLAPMNADLFEWINSTGQSFLEFPALRQMMNTNQISPSINMVDNSEILDEINSNLLRVNDSINNISGRVHILEKDIYKANRNYDLKIKNRRIY